MKQLNAAQQLYLHWIEGSRPVPYKGTPRKPHYDRSEARAKAEKAYREGLKKPQPDIYRNSSKARAEAICARAKVHA